MKSKAGILIILSCLAGAGAITISLLQNGLPLTGLEKFYLQEFLNTLNDSALINDPRFE